MNVSFFKRRAHGLSVVVLGFLFSLLTSCGEPPPAPTLKMAGATMGTSYHITVVLPQSAVVPDAVPIQALIDTRLVEINRQMSTYIDDSEISRFNRLAVGEWLSIGAEFFHVLLLSIETSWLTGGSFDITVGPLVDAWGFGAGSKLDERGRPSLPTDSQVAELLLNTGFQHLQLDLAKIQLSKSRPVQLNVSAIAKGYAVDQIASLLSEQGFVNYMVEIGGELRLAGHNRKGLPWRIAIEQPGSGFGEVHRAIAVSDKAVATSGDYRNFYELDGNRYAHTINPLNGRPVPQALASVTVVAEEAALADAYATAIGVLGPKAGLKLAEQQGLAIYLLLPKVEGDGFDIRYSQAFKPYLEPLK